MNSPTSWEYYKQDQDKILWVHIRDKDLHGISISINKWWKTKYPEYKMRVVSSVEIEKVKILQLKKKY